MRMVIDDFLLVSTIYCALCCGMKENAHGGVEPDLIGRGTTRITNKNN